MTPPENHHMEVWDRDYRTRGLLWGGIPAPLPDLPGGSRVLELGCGNGKNIPGLIGKPWDIIALDCSKNALLLCRRKVNAAGRVNFLAGDSVRLPFRDSMMDAVFSLHMAGHLKESERAHFAGEVSRVLKPGGHLLFRDFGTGDFRCGNGEEIEPFTFLRGTGSFTHYFTENEVCQLFRSFNCSSIDNHRWSMKVKGCNYQRCEIVAVFEKKA